MTPLAREVYEHTKGSRKPGADKLIGLLRSCVWFELSGIELLILQTRDALRETKTEKSSPKLRKGAAIGPFQEGGLLVMPHGTVGFEWASSDARYLFLTEFEEGLVGGIDRINCTLFCKLSEQDKVQSQFGILLRGEELYIQVEPESQYLLIGGGTERPPWEETKVMAIGHGLLIAAAIITINAPYGITKEQQPIHKGHAKQARREGWVLKPHHKVTIDKSKGQAERYHGASTGHHKAFHFVRGHARCLDRDAQRYTSVKPHWRGDPALGVLETDEYLIKYSAGAER